MDNDDSTQTSSSQTAWGQTFKKLSGLGDSTRVQSLRLANTTRNRILRRQRHRCKAWAERAIFDHNGDLRRGDESKAPKTDAGWSRWLTTIIDSIAKINQPEGSTAPVATK